MVSDGESLEIASISTRFGGLYTCVTSYNDSTVTVNNSVDVAVNNSVDVAVLCKSLCVWLTGSTVCGMGT